MTNLPPISPQPTLPINKTATLVNKIIAGAETGIVNVAESLAIADCPWLGWPGVKQIWEAAFSFVADKFTRAAQTGATFIVIDHQVDGEEKGLSAALIELKNAELSGDAVRIKKTIQDYANANSALDNSDGSAHPTV